MSDIELLIDNALKNKGLNVTISSAEGFCEKDLYICGLNGIRDLMSELFNYNLLFGSFQIKYNYGE